MKKMYPLFFEIKSTFLREKKRYFFVFLLFGTGILLGSITAARIKSDSVAEMKSYFDRFFSAYTLQGTAKSEAFRIALINYAQLLFWVWLSGWSFWLMPIGFFQVILKGFRTGYTIIYFLKCYHFKGILVTTLSILPQNLILLPALCFYAVFLIQFAIDRKNLKKK